jgi:hypothetical protein
MVPSAVLRRLWRAQLRLRVMAGVVIVMLLAIAAFDIGAVATMRRYLLGQTDQNLQVTLAMTRIQLPSLLPGYPFAAAVHPSVAQAPRGRWRERDLDQRIVVAGAVAPRRVQHHLLPARR